MTSKPGEWFRAQQPDPGNPAFFLTPQDSELGITGLIPQSAAEPRFHHLKEQLRQEVSANISLCTQ